MSTLTPTVMRWFADHHGIASADDLTRLGVTTDRRVHLLHIGVLVIVHRGVYRIASTPSTFESRCRAACAASPDVGLSEATAARLWAFRGLRPCNEIYVMAPHGAHPFSCDVLVRRTNHLPQNDLVELPGGLRVTTPPRTAFDLARHVPDPVLETIIEQVLDRHCSMPTLWEVARRLGGHGRPGAARFNRVLSLRPAWQKPAQSGIEFRTLKAIEHAIDLTLVRQFGLRLHDGTRIHLDGADPSAKWGVEIDHVTWHGGRIDAQRDKGRDRGARRLGWQIERVTDLELKERFDSVIAELAELHRHRSREFRAA